MFGCVIDLSKLTAKDVLWAIRLYQNRATVLREVTVPDPVENARRNLWNTLHPTYGDYYRKRHEENPGRWPLAESLPEGWKPHNQVLERRIDALIIERQRTAIEIKVTRSDFKADTEEKRAPWAAYTHRFVYAVPTGLVSPDEVPDYCGLWYVDPEASRKYQWQHGVSVVKKAKINKEPMELPDRLVKSLLGRLSRYEYQNEKR